jgi:hypothetical protein
MARVRRPAVRKPSAIGALIARRADEEKARHPEKTYAQIGRELGIKSKDPARTLRKLRSGESSGRVTIKRLLAPPIEVGGRPDIFTVHYQWWYTDAPEFRRWARTNVKVARARGFDVFRLRDDPRINEAVIADIERKRNQERRQRDGSIPMQLLREFDFEVDGVGRVASQRIAPIEIFGRRSA